MTLSNLVQKLGATASEVHRNLERLTKANIIFRDNSGYYHLTNFGKVIHFQIPVWQFMTANVKYFQKHGFAGLPPKFIQRMGDLLNSKYLNGFVRTQEQWKIIYKNANEYIYNILYEVPYDPKLLETLAKKIRDGLTLNSIFSESAIVPTDRAELLNNSNFKKIIDENLVKRKLKSDVKTIVVLNEKEACVMFPTNDGDPDVSGMLYSSDPQFHDWCLDYFKYCWDNSTSFREEKIQK